MAASEDEERFGKDGEKERRGDEHGIPSQRTLRLSQASTERANQLSRIYPARPLSAHTRLQLYKSPTLASATWLSNSTRMMSIERHGLRLRPRLGHIY